MSTVTFHSTADAKATARCQNCDWTGPFDDTLSIVDVEHRVTPGEIVPAGECPKCGSLAHLDPPPEWSPLAKLAQVEAELQTLRAAAFDVMFEGRSRGNDVPDAVIAIMTTAEHIAAAERFILEGIADREHVMATETDYSLDDIELTRADIARAHQFIADAKRGQ